MDLNLYASKRDTSDWLMPFKWATIGKRLIGPRVLELGCSRGDMSVLLTAHPAVKQLIIVDGSDVNTRRAKKRVPNAACHTSLWEDWEDPEQYDDIVLSCGLEHVDDPVKVLVKIKTLMSNTGQLHIIVPNANSIHRRVGLTLGMIPSLDSFSPGDEMIGHQRVYTRIGLVADIREAGLRDCEHKGLVLKPVDNLQIINTFNEDQQRALYELGKHISLDLCAEIYIRCAK